jgi:hypothetical protein
LAEVEEAAATAAAEEQVDYRPIFINLDSLYLL